jgi:4-amino-4-deoxy-L-arabinose transferase-like glycosyltransferase
VKPLWIVLILLTLLRLLFASIGHLSEGESYLLLCAHHLDWGFVEGPAGVPALMRLNQLLFGESPLAVRWLSPLLLLCSSWLLWQLTVSLRDKKTAFWTVIIFNALPLANAAGVVMEGTMLVTLCWLAVFKAAWDLLSRDINQNRISDWVIFGILLGVATQASYVVGWLLPVVVIAIVMRPWRLKNFFGIVVTMLLLALSWLPLLWWNSHHDWLQWEGMTWDSFWSWPPCSNECLQYLPIAWLLLLLVPLLIAAVSAFCPFSGFWILETPFFLLLSVPLFFAVNELGHGKVPFALLLVSTALLLPSTVDLFFQKQRGARLGLLLLIALGCCSFALLLSKIRSSTAHESAWNFPSATGVIGAEAAGHELLRLRASYTDTSSGRAPFLIAETPGLAALLGALLPISYPEMQGAPSVFIPESPALVSQFLLWPHYADATTANSTPDPLYTEETAVSPFLGHDAFYITTESSEEIPQTVSGAFAAIVPLGLVLPLQTSGGREELKIYLCQNYQMLSL